MSQIDNGQSQSTESGQGVGTDDVNAEQTVNGEQTSSSQTEGSNSVAETPASNVSTDVGTQEDKASGFAKIGDRVEKSDGSAYPNGTRVQGVVLFVEDDGRAHVGWFSEVAIVDKDEVNVL